jgi:hypothetical protein
MEPSSKIWWKGMEPSSKIWWFSVNSEKAKVQNNSFTQENRNRRKFQMKRETAIRPPSGHNLHLCVSWNTNSAPPSGHNLHLCVSWNTNSAPPSGHNLHLCVSHETWILHPPPDITCFSVCLMKHEFWSEKSNLRSHTIWRSNIYVFLLSSKQTRFSEMLCDMTPESLNSGTKVDVHC